MQGSGKYSAKNDLDSLAERDRSPCALVGQAVLVEATQIRLHQTGYLPGSGGFGWPNPDDGEVFRDGIPLVVVAVGRDSNEWRGEPLHEIVAKWNGGTTRGGCYGGPSGFWA